MVKCKRLLKIIMQLQFTTIFLTIILQIWNSFILRMIPGIYLLTGFCILPIIKHKYCKSTSKMNIIYNDNYDKNIEI